MSIFFCDHMDHSLPGSSLHGISQARILERIAISFSRRSSPPRDQTYISCTGRPILYHWATREACLGFLTPYFPLSFSLPSFSLYIYFCTYWHAELLNTVIWSWLSLEPSTYLNIYLGDSIQLSNIKYHLYAVSLDYISNLSFSRKMPTHKFNYILDIAIWTPVRNLKVTWP